MPREEKAPGTGRKLTRDSQIELPLRNIAFLKAREVYEMKLSSLDLKRQKTPADIWIIFLCSLDIE